MSIQASGRKGRPGRILGLAESEHNDAPPKNSVPATMTGYSALYPALDAESLRDEPMRGTGCFCAWTALTRLGMSRGSRVSQWVTWLLEMILFLSQVDTMGFSFLILSDRFFG